MGSYEEACACCAVEQGLGELVVGLAAAGIPVTVDQTGGMTMCVRVSAPGGWFWVTASDDEGYLVGRYVDDGECLDSWDGLTVADVVERVR